MSLNTITDYTCETAHFILHLKINKMVESHILFRTRNCTVFPRELLYYKMQLKVQIFLAFVHLNTPNTLPHLLFHVTQSNFAMWKDTECNEAKKKFD